MKKGRYILCIMLLIGWLGQCRIFASETDSVKTRSGISRLIHNVIHYFEDANQPHPERKLDISFIGGPDYSKEKGFGLGIVSQGVYYTARDASGMPAVGTPPSVVSLKMEVTTGQLYKISGEGYNIFPGDKFRINYDGCFYSFKDKFWGIGYKADANNANESVYKRFEAQVKADFVVRFGKAFFVGPVSRFSYVNATRADRPELFEGQALRTFTTGLGITATYDTRDVPFNAYRGVLVRFQQIFNPRFLANKYAFSRTEFTAAGYGQVWKGGVFAAQVHADLTFGNTPWGLMPSIGTTESLRGYYEGRYRDKCEMDVVLELRQHVWRRNGIVLWVGAGSIFPKFSAFKWTQILPNAGIGYRWQFKPRANVRLDLGIGRGEKGISFSINEAF